jgi:bacteriocin-like protein
MSKKSEQKPSDPTQDASLEISDEELKKVSGGVGAHDIRSIRNSVRVKSIRKVGLRDNPTGGKF